jgi:sugar lactone lactonase YvrE
MRRSAARIGLAVAIAFAVAASAALAATGGLTAKGCIADTAHNPGACTPTTAGLYGANGVALSPDGRSVYVAGGNSNALVTFKRNRKTGKLTPKGCIADPANNPEGCAKTAAGVDYPYAVVVSADGRSVYVGSYEGNAVVRLKRNRKTGALTPAGCIAEKGDNPDGCSKTTPGLYNVESLAISPLDNALYAGGDVGAVVRFKRSKATGSLTPKGCVGDPLNNYENCKRTAKGLSGDIALAMSTDGKSLYVGSGANAIVSFKANKKTGELHPKGSCIADAAGNPEGCAETTANMAKPLSLAVSPDGKSVYAGGYNSSSLVRFKRDRTSGAITPAGCYGGGGCTAVVGGLHGIDSIAVSPDSKSVYTAAYTSSAIVGFARNMHTGALTTKQCVADTVSNPDGCVDTASGLLGAASVAVSPNGKSVYVAGKADNAVVRFNRSP